MIATLITIIIVIIVIFLIIRYIKKKSKLVYVTPANYQQVVSASSLGSTTGTTNNCTYSIWVYVNDWSVNYGEPKVIFNRGTGAVGGADLSVFLGNYEPTLFVRKKILTNKRPYYETGTTAYFSFPSGWCNTSGNTANIGNTSNNLCWYKTSNPTTDIVKVEDNCTVDDNCLGFMSISAEGNTPAYFTNGGNGTYTEEDITSSMYPMDEGGGAGFYGIKKTPNFKTCSIPNFELQRWTNIVLSANTNEMDIYINGKLMQSCNLEGEININNANNVYISPNGQGFNGWNSKFQFWPNYINPHQAMAIYRRGHGGSNTGSLNYKLNVSLYDGTTEKASVTI